MTRATILMRVRQFVTVFMESGTKPQILRGLEKILLGGFLGELCVLAVNADLQFNRQGAKDAKKTPSRTIWLRLCCAV